MSYFDDLPDAATQTMPNAPPLPTNATAKPATIVPATTTAPTSSAPATTSAAPAQGSYLTDLPDAADQSSAKHITTQPPAPKAPPVVAATPVSGMMMVPSAEGFTMPVYDTSTPETFFTVAHSAPEGDAAQTANNTAGMRMVEKFGEGASLGTLPFLSDDLRKFSEETDRMYPGMSLATKMAGGFVPGAALGGAVIDPVEGLLLKETMPWLGRLGIRTGVQGTVGAGFGAANAVGEDVGSGKTENIGGDALRGALWGAGLGAAAPSVGAALEVPFNLGRQALSIFTKSGQDTVARRVLAESVANPALKDPAKVTDPANWSADPTKLPSSTVPTYNDAKNVAQIAAESGTALPPEETNSYLLGTKYSVDPATGKLTFTDAAPRYDQQGYPLGTAKTEWESRVPIGNDPQQWLQQNLYDKLQAMHANGGVPDLLHENNADALKSLYPTDTLPLRTAQSSGDAGLANLEKKIAPEVQQGRTPEQSHFIIRTLLGGRDMGPLEEPEVLAADASKRGTQAIRNIDDQLDTIEQDKWNDPALAGAKLNGPAIGAQVAKDVASDTTKFPASYRDAINGSFSPYLRELQELQPDASIKDVNSIVSRLRGEQRAAGGGLTPNPVKAAAAGRLADTILDHMQQDPGIAGRPAGTYQPTGKTGLPIGFPQALPEIKPNDAAWKAFQEARNFTRARNEIFDYPEFHNLLQKNSSGQYLADPAETLGHFFDVKTGTSENLMHLGTAIDSSRNLANEASSNAGKVAAQNIKMLANQADQAANDYMRSSVYDAARQGSGFDATSNPAINLNALQATARRVQSGGAVGILPDNPMQSTEQAVEDARRAAELVNGPSLARNPGTRTSPTLRKVQRNELISAILNKGGSTATGALLGAYFANEHLPEAIPWYMRLAIGTTAGAALGRVTVPHLLGKVTAHQGEAIVDTLREALRSRQNFERLMTTRLPSENVYDHGTVSRAVESTARAATPAITDPQGPTINQATGLPQYNLTDAQRAKAESIIRSVRGKSADEVIAWVNANKRDLRTAYGGQGINRIVQIASLLRRAEGDNRAPATLLSLAATNPSSGLQKALGEGGVNRLAALAIGDAGLAKLLATKTTASKLPKAAEAHLVRAIS